MMCHMASMQLDQPAAQVPDQATQNALNLIIAAVLPDAGGLRAMVLGAMAPWHHA